MSPISSSRAQGSAPNPIGIGLALAGAIAFSGKAIIVKLCFRYGVDAITLIALRMLFAFPLFALAALWPRREKAPPLSQKDRLAILVLGFLGYYLASFLDFLGLQYVTATLERLILYLNPTLVLFIGFVFLKRRISRAQLGAVAVSYLGVALAVGHDMRFGGTNIALGTALVFGSAVAYALYLVGSGEVVRRVGALRLTAWASCVACLLCLAQFVLTRPIAALAVPAPVFWFSLLNGVACTVLPVFFVMLAIARLGAAPTAQIGMIGPVSTILLGHVFLHEDMGPWQVAGTFFVLTGVFLVSRQRVSQGDLHERDHSSDSAAPVRRSGSPAA